MNKGLSMSSRPRSLHLTHQRPLSWSRWRPPHQPRNPLQLWGISPTPRSLLVPRRPLFRVPACLRLPHHSHSPPPHIRVLQPPPMLSGGKIKVSHALLFPSVSRERERERERYSNREREIQIERERERETFGRKFTVG